MNQPLQYYIERYITGSITDEELRVFALMLEEPEHLDSLHVAMDEAWKDVEGLDADFSDVTDRVEKNLLQRIESTTPNITKKPTPVIYFMRRWGWVAAIFIIALFSAIYFVSSDHKPGTAEKNIVSTPSDVAPGTNRAILKVDNNQTIDLSNDQSGIVVSGEVTYDNGEFIAGTGESLLLVTPRGGQYEAMLPDGTKVWLNAASSVEFPSKFADNERTIKITGEVYLEVAKDKTKPFYVDVDGHSLIQVTGTSFNVNAYADDGSIKTTLIEGAVKVFSDNNKDRLSEGSVAIKPGQQAVQGVKEGNAVKVRSNVNVEEVVAWKNGLFQFDNTPAVIVMRQLERWYDITVKYEGEQPSFTVYGEMYRNVNLSDVLTFLEKSGMKFKLEERKLIIY